MLQIPLKNYPKMPKKWAHDFDLSHVTLTIRVSHFYSDPGFKLTNLATGPTKYLCQIKTQTEKF